MIISKTIIKNLYLLKDLQISDSRGYFNRYFSKDFLNKKKISFKPDYQAISFNKKKGTIRGMHMQKYPYSEIKLVKCVFGSIFDVVIDLRKSSPSFNKIFTIVLKEGDGKSILIPKGCVHGYQSLSSNSKLLYSIQSKYNKNAMYGIKWNDPLYNIKWPLKISKISEHDKNFKNEKL